MNKILEEFETYISTNKDILSALPTKTSKNVETYLEKLDEMIVAANKIKDIVWDTIKKRYQKLTDLEEGSEIEALKKQIEGLKDVSLLNELSTAYEKFGFDRINHNLSLFYEADLTLLNENIKSFLDKFSVLGITLLPEDFGYSNFVNQYMTLFLEEYSANNLKSERLKKKFEEIYWKCPDIVTHIEMNLRYLYNFHEKEIETYLDEKNGNFMVDNSLNKVNLVKKNFDLNAELIKARNIDPKNVLQKFIDGKWKIKDYNKKSMKVLYDKLYNGDYDSLSEAEQIEVNKNFRSLYYTLKEFEAYNRYKYIIKELKDRASNKDSYKGVYEKKLKEVKKKESDLLKENEKYNKMLKSQGSPLNFLRKNKIKQEIYDYPVASNLKIKEIKELYDELDEEKVNVIISKYIDDTCTLKYILKIAVSFYSFCYKLIAKRYEEDSDVNLEDEYKNLQEFIDQPFKVMLNNIKSIEEPEITSIISNRYKIMKINLEKVDLEENLETLVADAEKIVDYNNIVRSGLNFSDIEFVEKVTDMLNKN